ncbi:MAG: DUF362 domain-containing protein [Desulfovibrio sp.]|jgi:hypothetical protein|nr:DUF362 domain-containing protein [Desulfovibrio sp.]
MNACLPFFFGVDQSFDSACLDDPGKAVADGFRALFPSGASLKNNGSVAVCVGSRGIASLPKLVRATLDALQALSLEPFIVPAMGSHGGATPEGQIRILRDLGVTEASMGVEVISSLAVTDIKKIPDGPTARFSSDALAADYVVPVCRVKEHTVLTGDIQSGLCKMIVIGCAKDTGALEYHRHDITRVLLPSAEAVIQVVPFLCGVAVVENAYDRICELRVVKPEDFVSTDRELLVLAKKKLARLPFLILDALILDEIGKNISGSGADLNVIGKWRRDGGPRVPDYQVHAALDLTDASHGNATGIGFMDIISERLLRKIDVKATFVNSLTSGYFRSCRIPMYMEDDKAVLETILNSLPDRNNAAMARIINTLKLERFWATAKALESLPGGNFKIDRKGQKPCFDKEGRLLPFL